jgi:predicted protein tyrosine phosphatase
MPTYRFFNGEKKAFWVLPRRKMSVYPEAGLSIAGREHLVISITDPETKEAFIPFAEGCKGILRLSFWDVEKAIGHYKLMPKEDAEKIALFVKANSEVPLIIVHCEMGVSRSPAVAAALSQYYNGENEFFFKNYTPNSWVYAQVLEAMQGEVS